MVTLKLIHIHKNKIKLATLLSLDNINSDLSDKTFPYHGMEADTLWPGWDDVALRLFQHTFSEVGRHHDLRVC